jgi:peroxiredoxin
MVITLKQKKLFVFILLAALISIPLVLVRIVQSRYNGNLPALGMPVPSLTVSTMNGNAFHLSQSGHKSVLLFFSVDCPHCINELSHFDSLNIQFKKKINIIAISMSNINSTKALLASRQYPFPVFQSEESASQDSMRIIELPTILYIDEQQILRHLYIGERTIAEERMLLTKFTDGRFSEL